MNTVADGTLSVKPPINLDRILGVCAEAAQKGSDVWNKIRKADAAAERVFYLMDQPTEIDMLIIDETISQVDAENEAKLRCAIEKLMVYLTTFIIAHRFGTVVTAYQTVVLDKGSAGAPGTHKYQGLYKQDPDDLTRRSA